MYTVERQTCNKTSKRSSGSSSLRERKVESTEALSDSIRLSNLNNSLHQVPVLCWAQEYPHVYKLLGKQIQLKYEISDHWENNFSSTVALSDRVLYIVRKRDFLNDLRGKVKGIWSEESAWQCRRLKRCWFNSWVRKIPWSRK